MADKDDNKNKGSNKAVWAILWIITLGVIFLSLWYYSGLVYEYTGELVSQDAGSIYYDIAACS